MDVEPLNTVAGGFISLMDNNLLYKCVEQIGGQLCRFGVFLNQLHKTFDIGGLRFRGFDGDAQAL